MWPRASPGQRIYVAFDPPQELVQGKDAATMRIVLPGYKKEHIKIGINNYGRIRITGERQMTDARWSRFVKEFQVPDYCDASKISARFDDELLQVTLPKLDAGDNAKDDSATKAAEENEASDGSKNGTKRRAESGAGESGGGEELVEASKDHLQKVEENGKDRTKAEPSSTDKVKSDSKHGNSSWKNLRNAVQLGRRQLVVNGVAAAIMAIVGLGLYVIYKKQMTYA